MSIVCCPVSTAGSGGGWEDVMIVMGSLVRHCTATLGRRRVGGVGGKWGMEMQPLGP